MSHDLEAVIIFGLFEMGLRHRGRFRLAGRI
jgi:hypothetical protein